MHDWRILLSWLLVCLPLSADAGEPHATAPAYRNAGSSCGAT